MDSNEMTPEEERAFLMAEWLGILAELWTAIGKPVEKDRLYVYQRQLGKVPMGLLRASVDRLLREHAYSNVPPIGTVWAAVIKELGDPHDVVAALERWEP